MAQWMICWRSIPSLARPAPKHPAPRHQAQWPKIWKTRSTLRVDNRKYVDKDPKKRSRNPQLENNHLRAQRRAVGIEVILPDQKGPAPVEQSTRKRSRRDWETGDSLGNTKLCKLRVANRKSTSSVEDGQGEKRLPPRDPVFKNNFY